MQFIRIQKIFACNQFYVGIILLRNFILYIDLRIYSFYLYK